MSAYVQYRYSDAQDGWAMHYLLSALMDMLGPPRGTLLDLGCGNGAIARALLAHGYDVYGVDGSVSGIAHADAAVPGRFFVCEFGDDLPSALSGRRFDTVISTEVIEHLYDPRGFLAFARALLLPEGRLLLSTPYHGYLKNLVLAVSGRLDQHFTVLWDGGHIKFFSRRSLEQMLRETGFCPTRFAGAGRLPFLWKSMLIESRVAEEQPTP